MREPGRVAQRGVDICWSAELGLDAYVTAHVHRKAWPFRGEPHLTALAGA